MLVSQQDNLPYISLLFVVKKSGGFFREPPNSLEGTSVSLIGYAKVTGSLAEEMLPTTVELLKVR